MDNLFEKMHVYPRGDWLPHVTTGGYCPCEPRIEGDLVIHNSWDGRELNEIDADWCRPKIRVFRDGDQWCALAGRNIREGFAGFGDTPQEACGNLLKGNYVPALDTPEEVWAALLNEEITMSRAAELLGLPFVEVREECDRRLGQAGD